MTDTAPRHRATQDGEVYPHILACPAIVAVLLFDQTGRRRVENAVGRYTVDHSVCGRDWIPSPQDFVRLLEMASGRRMIDWMRMGREVGSCPQTGELGLAWAVLASSDDLGCAVLGHSVVETALVLGLGLATRGGCHFILHSGKDAAAIGDLGARV